MAQLGVENVAYHENNNVHRMNKCKWTDKQRHRIIEIDKKREQGENMGKDGTTNFQ